MEGAAEKKVEWCCSDNMSVNGERDITNLHLQVLCTTQCAGCAAICTLHAQGALSVDSCTDFVCQVLVLICPALHWPCNLTIFTFFSLPSTLSVLYFTCPLAFHSHSSRHIRVPFATLAKGGCDGCDPMYQVSSHASACKGDCIRSIWRPSARREAELHLATWL